MEHQFKKKQGCELINQIRMVELLQLEVSPGGHFTYKWFHGLHLSVIGTQRRAPPSLLHAQLSTIPRIINSEELIVNNWGLFVQISFS